MESEKQNKLTVKTNKLIDKEKKLIVAKWGRGLGKWVKKVKGLRSIHRQLQNSHGDIK